MNFDLIKDRLLLASVFLTGAGVLIIEIVAIRILSPYYGNTIYTTSSVIGTVLAALSLGYYLGGILSDKYPEYEIFYGIILVSGFLVVFMQILAKNLLPFFSTIFSITLGPFISSIFLFFMPAFFLGTLSPFAIKLHEKKSQQNNLGTKSGEVFFWSTLGSIAGSFFSGFILIPHVGINLIIFITGIIISLWALFCFLFFYKIDKKILVFIILFFIFELLLFWLYWPKKESNFLYDKDGIYEKIRVIDSSWLGKPARFLVLDRSNSSAIYLDSKEMAFEYTKYYKLYKLFRPEAENIFVIGGGAYSIPEAILQNSTKTKVDVAEIEPELFNIAKKYFNVQETNRLSNYTEDGRHFLSKSNKKYDVIISDVYYSLFSIPMHFTTKEFFELAKSKLQDNGVFIGNFAGKLDKNPPSLILSEIKTFKDVFENSYFFAVNSPNENSAQNIIFLGINGNKKINFDNNGILHNNDSIISNLPEKNINLEDFKLSEYQEITDNFSPIEYLVSKVIR